MCSWGYTKQDKEMEKEGSKSLPEDKKTKICCVTGGSGYIGSCLVKKLLEKGHIVHTTLRNLGDSTKVGVVKGFSGADTRLKLFQADLYDVDCDGFASAIGGCEFVFHVATPLVHNTLSAKYKDTVEAALESLKNILRICVASTTVKKFIYTGSVVASSPLLEDGSGFKDFMDEFCWTPTNISYAYCEDFEEKYIVSKTLSEKEVLEKNNDNEESRLKVASLACALVGGRGVIPYQSLSPPMIVSPFTGDGLCYNRLKYLQALIGCVPFIHLEDVCDAHLFCMENDHAVGRFICASHYPTLLEIIDIYREKDFGFQLVHSEVEEDLLKKVRCISTKLEDLGFNFKYKHDFESIIKDTVEYAKELGLLPTIN